MYLEVSCHFHFISFIQYFIYICMDSCIFALGYNPILLLFCCSNCFRFWQLGTLSGWFLCPFVRPPIILFFWEFSYFLLLQDIPFLYFLHPNLRIQSFLKDACFVLFYFENGTWKLKSEHWVYSLLLGYFLVLSADRTA